MTLLPPLKQLFSARLPQRSIFDSAPETQSESEAAPPLPTPREVLKQIGQQLAQARELNGLSIEEISARTQIQTRVIRALEQGQIEMLPESVYVRGTIKRYANCMGIDGAALSARVLDWNKADADFDDRPTVLQVSGFHTPTAPATSSLPERTNASQNAMFGQIRPQFKPLQVYLGYLLALVTVGAAGSYLLESARDDKSASLNGASNFQPSTPVAKRIPAIAAPKPLPRVKIAIAAKSAAWAQIGIDGVTQFTGNLSPGAQLNLSATKQVTVSTNNAGALSLAQASQPPQVLGKVGETLHTTIKVTK